MKARKIKEGIYWVGAIDWNIRNFHGYLTQMGTTYNAYLIIDEKITLIDSVKPNLSEEMFRRISDIIDPSKIDIVVSLHTEMDHSGAIPMVMEKATNASLYCSPNGEKGLKAHYKKDWNFVVVNPCEPLNIGKRNLHFLLTPMVHWPDNMVAYIPEEKMLFSNDAFGQHLSSSERIDYEYPLETILQEAKKYYANIVLPYSKPVLKVLEEVDKLDIEYIATSHGIIWKDHIKEIIAEYKKWASNSVDKKAVIIYDTMWHSTEKIAYAIQSAFESKGYNTVFCNLQNNHISDIMTDLINAEYICVGSPTLNHNMMPNVAGFLTYMSGLAPKGRKAVSFGSYGWGGQSINQVTESLEQAGFEIVASYKLKYIPSPDELKCIENDLIEKIH